MEVCLMKRKITFLLALVFLTGATGVYAVSEAANAADAAANAANKGKVQATLTLEDKNMQCSVNATRLNLRQGPSTEYEVVKVLEKGHVLQVLGRIGNWAAVFDPQNGLIGAVDSKYLTFAGNPGEGDATAASTAPTDISEDEQKLLDLVNKARAEAGLNPLSLDKTLMNTARLKAQDMAENNYFSHQSPKYGSPFDMMRQFGLEFKAAGENIAGNETVEGAFQAWMSTEAHKKNILNKNFNYVGIGIASNKTYGKIVVQQFIGR